VCTGQVECAEERSHLTPDRWLEAEAARARRCVVSGKYEKNRVARLGTAQRLAVAESGVKKINRVEQRA